MTNTDDAASATSGEPERDLAGELEEGLRKIEANERAAADLWVPSPMIEHLLWQVCGAWETVVEKVRLFNYSLEETPPTTAPFVSPEGGTVARDMRRIARRVNLRLPGNSMWTDECERAKTMRDHLGHMLHFKSIDGTAPNQVVTLSRVPFREPDEMSTSGGMAMHRRIEITITAEDARGVLDDLSDVDKCIGALHKFGVQFNTRPDTWRIGAAADLLPWWLSDWGPIPDAPGYVEPTMRKLRIQPKADFDASLPPGLHPEF